MADYVMQMLVYNSCNMVKVQYGKRAHYIVLWKEPHKNKPLFIDNVPL